ncbi:hypothetical protein Tco_0487983 [Tanacetum coccineum]
MTCSRLHNFTTSSQLHNFTTSLKLHDFFTTSRLHFTTLLISQLPNTTCEVHLLKLENEGLVVDKQRNEFPYFCASKEIPRDKMCNEVVKVDGVSVWTVVGENSLEEEMLMGSSNHLVRVMLMILVIWVCNQLKMKKCLWIDEFWRVHEEKIDLGNGSSIGGHECVWLLMMSEGDGELVLCIWREFMGRDLFENGMNLDKFREFQMLFKHYG